jgi:hypothetical protein
VGSIITGKYRNPLNQSTGQDGSMKYTVTTDRHTGLSVAFRTHQIQKSKSEDGNETAEPAIED